MAFIETRKILLSWYRIISFSTPWITTENALCCQPTSFEKPMLFERLKCVLRASRGVATSSGCIWRNCKLIEPYQKNKRCYQYFFHHCYNLRNTKSSSFFTIFQLNTHVSQLISNFIRSSEIFVVSSFFT